MITKASQVSKGESKMEQRRLLWTTYHNISKWFDTLKEELLDLGFA